MPKFRKKRQVVAVSKISSSVTPSAKNGSLFFRDDFFFFFSGKGFHACMDSLHSSRRNWETYWHMHWTKVGGMLLRSS